MINSTYHQQLAMILCIVCRLAALFLQHVFFLKMAFEIKTKNFQDASQTMDGGSTDDFEKFNP